MKQLTCEMCGSTDLMKQDGVFVCQTCGCKYSVEEAKKLMVEGIVEVSGTVAINKAKETENLLIIARRSFKNGQYKLSAQQYNDILKNDPNNAEAAFFSVLSDSIDCKVGEIRYSANVVKNSMDSCTKLVNQINNIKDKEKLVEQIVNSTIVASKVFIDSANKYMNNCGRTTQAMYESIQMQGASGKMITELAECIINNIDYSKNIYNSVIKCYTYILSIVEKKYKPKYEEKIEELKKIMSSNENKISQKKKEEFEKKPEDEKKKIKYNKAKNLMNNNDIDSIEEALKVFKKIDPYEDSKLKIQKCAKKLEELKSKKYAENKEKYEKFCNNYNDIFDNSKNLEEKNISDNVIDAKQVQEIFSKLNYKDSEQIAEDMKNKMSHLDYLSEEISNEVIRRSKIILIVWIVISFTVGIIVWLIRSSKYNDYVAPPQWLAYGGIPTLLILIPIVLELIKKQREKIFSETIKKYSKEDNIKNS